MTTRYQARQEFLAARSEQQGLYGRAEVHRAAHGTYPAEYLAAQQATADAWGRYLDTPAAQTEPEPEAT